AIDIDLNGIFEKAINEHRAIGRYFNCVCHVPSEICLGINELHCAPAENEAWPNEHRISNFLCYQDGLFRARRRTVGSLSQSEFVQHGREQLSVFGGLDAFGLCSEDRDTRRSQSAGEV